MCIAHIHEGIKISIPYTKENLTVHTYMSLTKFILLFMQFILYCMAITTYNIKTEDLIHPIDQSVSRDFYSI